MKDLIIRKCNHCKAIVKVIDDCECPCKIVCCDEEMKVIVPNTFDAAKEKHVPTYKIVGDEVLVEVNHVMEEDHYIEWICAVSDNEEHFVYLKPKMEAKAKFKYIPGMSIYSYCNKHSLWKTDVE